LRNLDALLQSNADLSGRLLGGAVGNGASSSLTTTISAPGAAGAAAAAVRRASTAADQALASASASTSTSPDKPAKNIRGGFGGPFRTSKDPPFETSRFWRVGGAVPVPNADTLALAEAFRLSPRSFPMVRWSRGDDEALVRASVDAVRESRFAEALERSSAAGWRGEEGGEGNQAARAVAAAVAGTAASAPRSSSSLLDAAASAAASLTVDSPGVEDEIDSFSLERWDRIAASALPSRSGAALSARWREFLRPSVAALEGGGEGSFVPWSREEDAALKRAVGRHGVRSWTLVAKEVNDSAAASGSASAPPQTPPQQETQNKNKRHLRTPFACLSRYRRALDSATVAQGRWTPADDAALAAAVATHGVGNSWAAVAAALGEELAVGGGGGGAGAGSATGSGGVTRHWTSKQVFHRWRVLSGGGSGGVGNEATGTGTGNEANANASASAPPPPSSSTNLIIAPRTLGIWTREEDEALIDAVRDVGEGRWSLAAARVRGRTDVQCRGRYLRMLLPRARRLGAGATSAEVARFDAKAADAAAVAEAKNVSNAAPSSSSPAFPAATVLPPPPRVVGAGARRGHAGTAEVRCPHSGGAPFSQLERDLLLRARDDEARATREEGRVRLRWEPVLRRFRALLLLEAERAAETAAAEAETAAEARSGSRSRFEDRSGLMPEDVRVEVLKLERSRACEARRQERVRAAEGRRREAEARKRARVEAKAASGGGDESKRSKATATATTATAATPAATRRKQPAAKAAKPKAKAGSRGRRG